MAKSQSVWRALSAAVALGAGLASVTADAKDLVWTGGAGIAGTPILGDRNWYYQVCAIGCWQPNWNGGSLTNQTDDYPVFQDRLLFKNNGASETSNNNLDDLFIKQIVVDPNAPSYTITGKAFTLAPTSDIDDVGIHKFGRNTTLKIENDITLSGEVDFRNDGVIELTGLISGGSLTKTAGGTLILDRTDYTGFTNIRAGKVFLDGRNSITQSSRVELSGNGILETDVGNDSIGGTLFQNINSLSGTGGQIRLGAFSELIVNSTNLGTNTFAGNVTGAGDFTKSGGGTLVLSGRNSNTGALTINSGTLVLSNSNVNEGETQINGGSLVVAAGDSLSNSSLIRMSGGTLKYNSGVNDTAGGLHGTGSVVLESGSSGRFGGANINATFDGVISGTGEFVKNGTAQQTLRGHNAYTGRTIVRTGILRLDNDDVIADASAVSVETSGTLVLSSNHTDTVGSLTGSGDVTLQAGSTLTVGADGTDTTFSGQIDGDGNIAKTGAGTFTLSGNNTYRGNTTIDEGEVRLAKDDVLSDETAVTVNGATLSLDANRSDTIGSLAGSGLVALGTGSALTTGANGSSSEFSGVISGDGSVTKTGSGEMTLSGTNTYTGATTVAQGGLRLMGNNTLNPTSSLSITSAARLILDGDDSYELSPFNTAGTLQVETGSTFEAGANDSVSRLDGNGTVNLTTGDTFTIGEGFWTGQITGTGTVVKNGSINTLNLWGENTFTGVLDIRSGSVALRNGDNLADSLNVTLSHNNAGLVLGPNAQDTIGSLSGSGIVQLSSGSTLTVGGFGPGVPIRTVFSGRIIGDGGFTQTGFKLIEMTGQNTYTGDTTVDNGNIQISNNDVIADSSDVVIESGSLRLSRGFSDTVGSLSGSGGNVFIEDEAELAVGANNTSTTYSGSVRGDGALVKTGSGVMTLDGATLSVDELTVAGGQVRLNGTGALEMSSIKVNSGTSLNLFGRTRVDRVSADLVNDGFVFARLSGTIFDGDVSGRGDFIGRTIFNGSYGPGSSPALVQHQTTQFTSNHTLYMELGGLNRGSEYDAIDAFSVTLSGLLDVSLIDLNNGFSPMAGDTFDLIIANQIIGNFSTFSFAALADGLFWTTQLISSGSQMIYQLMVAGQLVNTDVPSPGAVFIFVVGLIGLVVVRCRSRMAQACC